MDRVDALRAFVRLAGGATFAETAATLNVRQPTVSKWLRRLEDEVGAQLIERTTRARRITPAGRRMEAHARQIVAAFDTAIADVGARAGQLQGRIRVSLPVVFGHRFLTPLLTAFLAEHRNIEAELCFSDAYVDLIGAGVDVAFRVGQPLDSTLRARTLARSRRCLVATPALAQRLAIERPADLAQAPCLVHSGRIARSIWRFERDGEVARAPVTGQLVADHSAALLALACAGLGIALLAEWLVADAVADGRLVELLPDYAAPPAPIQALTPPRAHHHPIARALIAHVGDHLPHVLPRVDPPSVALRNAAASPDRI